MMQDEFINLLHKERKEQLDLRQWGTIHTVYQWHPSIDEVHGKKQVADLYNKFGFTIFVDMYERARKIELINIEISEHQAQINRLKDAIEELS